MIQNSVGALTDSGMGRAIDLGECDRNDHAAIGRLARIAAGSYGMALVRGLGLTEDEFKTIVHAVGETVNHKFGEGQADLLKLNASREEGKIITGRGGLPLHTDGVIVGEQVDYIILYAADFDDLEGSGETFVVDQIAAWKDAPEGIGAIIGENRFLEYLVTDHSYFPTAPTGWYSIPTVRDYGRVRSLNLALAFDKEDEARSWEIRVPGLSATESDAALMRLAQYLRSERYSYQHRWQVGDLVVIDNQRTLHGRTAISAAGTRVLFRGQTTVSS